MVDFSNAEREAVRAAMDEPGYIAFLTELAESSGGRVCNDVHVAEIELVIDYLDAANLALGDVSGLLHGGDSEFSRFCLAFIKVEDQLDDGQQFNPDDPPVDNETSNEEYIGHSRTSVLQYAVLYRLLTQDRLGLKKFFVKIRQPHAGKYALRLMNFFDGLAG